MKAVVAALIEKDGQYLIARRSENSDLGGLWEFPGGKVEPGENDAEALEREIVEEFNTYVSVGKLLATTLINDDLTLKLYACKHILGAYKLNNHSEIKWASDLKSLLAFDLAPADADLLVQILGDNKKPSLNELEVGQAYKNDDIMRIFLVSGQGGMRKSNRANSLILFALHITGNPYEDTWGEDGVMSYTGMGLDGDQSIDYAQNRTLADSRENGIDIHLFESFEPQEYIYRGQVKLAGDPYYDRQKDSSGKDRQVVKFPIKVR